MKTLKKQAGLTMWGWLVIMLMVGSILMQVFIVITPVLNYTQMDNIVNSLVDDPLLKGKGKKAIWAKMRKLVQTNSINNFTPNKDTVKITPIKKGGLKVNVLYEQRVDYIWDLDFVLTFEREVEVK